MPRIAHITDLHLRHHMPGTAKPAERLSREMPAQLDRLTPALLAQGVEILVVTGDILDVPDEVLSRQAPGVAGDTGTNWPAAIEDDYRLFRRWLVTTGLPWVIIPGNHDDEASFDRVFPEAGAITDILGLRFVCFRDDLNDQRQPTRTGGSRALFQAALDDDAHDMAQVHVHHYTIAPPTFHRGWQYEYVEADAMKTALQASGRVRAVLSGHYHPGHPAFTVGGVTYAATPAFCEAPFPYRLLQVNAPAKTGTGPHSSVTDAFLDT